MYEPSSSFTFKPLNKEEFSWDSDDEDIEAMDNLITGSTCDLNFITWDNHLSLVNPLKLGPYFYQSEPLFGYPLLWPIRLLFERKYNHCTDQSKEYFHYPTFSPCTDGNNNYHCTQSKSNTTKGFSMNPNASVFIPNSTRSRPKYTALFRLKSESAYKDSKIKMPVSHTLVDSGSVSNSMIHPMSQNTAFHNNTNPMPQRFAVVPQCGYCKSIARPYIGHSRTQCPTLYSLNPCPICGAFGRDNHTPTYCPSSKKTVLVLREPLEEFKKRQKSRIMRRNESRIGWTFSNRGMGS